MITKEEGGEEEREGGEEERGEGEEEEEKDKGDNDNGREGIICNLISVYHSAVANHNISI